VATHDAQDFGYCDRQTISSSSRSTSLRRFVSGVGAGGPGITCDRSGSLAGRSLSRFCAFFVAHDLKILSS